MAKVLNAATAAEHKNQIQNDRHAVSVQTKDNHIFYRMSY